MIHFELVTLDGVKFGEEVHEVILPTPDGYIAIFEDHAPLVSLANAGIISVRRQENHPDDMMEHFATNGGIIEVEGNNIRILADEADKEDEINENEVKQALAKAKQLRAEAKDSISLHHAQQLIDRSNVRLKVADLRRRRRPR